VFILFQGIPKGSKKIISKGLTQVNKAKTVPNPCRTSVSQAPAANETPQATSISQAASAKS